MTLAAVSLSQANEWKLHENSRSDGTPALVRKVATGPGGKKVTLNLIEFSTNDFTLQVVDQGNDQKNRKYSNLRDAMEKTGCVAGLNGGFYVGRAFMRIIWFRFLLRNVKHGQ